MSTVGDVIEYLLAYERPGGGKIARFGGILITVPIFPAGMTITFSLFPYFNAYANIEFWQRFSPAIVPGALYFDSRHQGIQVQLGVFGTTLNSESHNTWIEVTESAPITTTITNISGVNQFFESVDSFLIVDSEADFKLIKKIIGEWGFMGNLKEEATETNRLLRALVEATPGAVMPSPQPPIGGG